MEHDYRDVVIRIGILASVSDFRRVFEHRWHLANASSHALKTAFAAVDAADILGRVLAFPVQRQSYRASLDEGTHLGPIAEDFRAAFGLGSSNEAISTVDAE